MRAHVLAAVLCPLVALGAYYPSLHIPLEQWTGLEVRHWLVQNELDELVPLFKNRSISGSVLQESSSRLLQEELGIKDAWLLRRFNSHYKTLLKEIADAQAHTAKLKQRRYTTADGRRTYLHPCQADSGQCDYSETAWMALSYAILPRITMLFNGLCGQPLTSLPLRYMFLWLIAPHTAVWQADMDAYGLPLMNWGIFFLHLLNLAAAMLLPRFEVRLFNRFFLKSWSTESVGGLHQMIVQAACIVLSLVDWLMGWYISWLLLLVIARDVFLTANRLMLLRTEMQRSEASE